MRKNKSRTRYEISAIVLVKDESVRRTEAEKSRHIQEVLKKYS